jgi:hypothetical protein
MSALEKRFHEIDELCEECSVATGQHTQLEAYKSCLKAKLMQEAERRGVTSISGQERDAYAHPDYIAFTVALGAAHEKKTSLEFKIKNIYERIRVWQTSESTRRAEMSLR